MLKGQEERSPKSPTPDDITRWFLIAGVTIIIVLVLIAYMVTRNTAVLNWITGTGSGSIVGAIIGYYFSTKK